MARTACWLLVALLAGAGSLRAQNPAEPAGALPRDVSALIARAEPAVACILVSRSPWYRKFGLVPQPEHPGVLGGYGPNERARAASHAIPPQDLHDASETKKALSARLDLADPNYHPEAFGTGLVVDDKELVLTCYHVVQDAAKIYVRLPNGHGSYADIHAADPRSDLAVLRLLTPGKRLTPIVLGNADELRRGQPVVALSNPYAAGFFDGQPCASAGIISNLRRRIPGRQAVSETSANPLYQYGILLQTDAHLPLGSSGGALLDARGECIAVTTALGAIAGNDAPAGFAFPFNRQIRKIVEVLKRGEEVEYGYLGVSLKDNGLRNGATVIFVQPRSPADLQAGLQSEEVIVAVDRTPIHDTQDLLLALGQFQAGDRVHLTIRRRGILDERDVTLLKYRVQGKTIASSTGKRPYVGGVRVDYSSILVQREPRTPIPPGVAVADVEPGSKAERLGVVREDLITRVGGRLVNTPEEFYRELPRTGPVALSLRRGNTNLSITWH